MKDFKVLFCLFGFMLDFYFYHFFKKLFPELLMLFCDSFIKISFLS